MFSQNLKGSPSKPINYWNKVQGKTDLRCDIIMVVNDPSEKARHILNQLTATDKALARIDAIPRPSIGYSECSAIGWMILLGNMPTRLQ